MSEKEEMPPNKFNFIWDDSVLIKSYDYSMCLAKADLAKRIAEVKSKKIANEKESKDSTPCESPNCKSEKEAETDFPDYAVGSYVRATYVDGIDYEAEIVSINYETGTCRIKYYGYGNEEETLMKDLVDSWGKKAREAQYTKSKLKQYSDNEEDVELKHNCKEYVATAVPPPPMPPMPPMIENDEDSENLSAMLMSWYMSGYHTGVYQGVRMARKQFKQEK